MNKFKDQIADNGELPPGEAELPDFVDLGEDLSYISEAASADPAHTTASTLGGCSAHERYDREKALDLAVDYHKTRSGYTPADIAQTAKAFFDFLTGQTAEDAPNA